MKQYLCGCAILGPDVVAICGVKHHRVEEFRKVEKHKFVRDTNGQCVICDSGENTLIHQVAPLCDPCEVSELTDSMSEREKRIRIHCSSERFNVSAVDVLYLLGVIDVIRQDRTRLIAKADA